jgi:hypothetical protein
LLVILMLIAAAVSGIPAAAQEAPPTPIPAVVNIEDPFGDANGLNDQGFGGDIGHQGENVTPSDAGSVSDFGKVWFTNDAETVSVHILTEAAAPATNGLRFDVFATPGEGSVAANELGCIRFVAIIGGKTQGQNTTYQGADAAKLFDACNDGTNWFDNGIEATVRIEEVEGGNGLLTITGPMSYSPFLAPGSVLAKPSAAARVAYGVEGAAAGAAVYTDNTVEGTDYTITLPTAEEVQPPGSDDPPGKGKKKGCPKGKGKKKGACPRNESASSFYGGGRTLYL